MRLQLSLDALFGIVLLAAITASVIIPLHGMFLHYYSMLHSVLMHGYNGTGNASSYSLPYGYSYGVSTQ
ncbi:hypothetical protein M1408_03775 [Candidatus Marsarchaeota archaeon]|jgi:hypothetical protein|nr:hypothetical protein [Candidatus Marsarchaeota archaeon]